MLSYCSNTFINQKYPHNIGVHNELINYVKLTLDKSDFKISNLYLDTFIHKWVEHKTLI